jgi:hypothetical protein
MVEGEYRPQPSQSEHIQTRQEGGTAAPGLPPTLNERAKPPPEGVGYGGGEYTFVQVDALERSLKIQEERQRRRVNRPIMVYLNSYQRYVLNPERHREELDEMYKRFMEGHERFVRSIFDPDAIEPWEQEQDLDQRHRIHELARADLTREEREEQDLEDAIGMLKRLPIMSGRINIAADDIGEEELAKLQRHNPEFMNPIITGVQKRPARQAKADRAVERICERHGIDTTDLWKVTP